jgi:hypothetical protein
VIRSIFRRATAGLALAVRLGAQENDPRAVQPERPTVATHAHTVAPGYVELEAGVQGDRIDRDSRAYGAPIVWKVGLASHVQLNVTTPAVFSAPGRQSGAGDVGIGVKWRLLDQHPVLGDFAVFPSVKLANGSAARGIGSGTTDVGFMAIASHMFGPVAMDLNGGYTRVGSATGVAAFDAALWTASFGFPVAGRLSWVAELFGSPTIDGTTTRSTVAMLTGPTYLVSTALGIDAGVITRLRGEMPSAIYAGLVWNLGKFPFVGRPAENHREH